MKLQNVNYLAKNLAIVATAMLKADNFTYAAIQYE
jgi:hypothetical protein